MVSGQWDDFNTWCAEAMVSKYVFFNCVLVSRHGLSDDKYGIRSMCFLPIVPKKFNIFDDLDCAHKFTIEKGTGKVFCLLQCGAMKVHIYCIAGHNRVDDSLFSSNYSMHYA